MLRAAMVAIFLTFMSFNVASADWSDDDDTEDDDDDETGTNSGRADFCKYLCQTALDCFSGTCISADECFYECYQGNSRYEALNECLFLKDDCPQFNSCACANMNKVIGDDDDGCGGCSVGGSGSGAALSAVMLAIGFAALALGRPKRSS